MYGTILIVTAMLHDTNSHAAVKALHSRTFIYKLECIHRTIKKIPQNLTSHHTVLTTGPAHAHTIVHVHTCTDIIDSGNQLSLVLMQASSLSLPPPPSFPLLYSIVIRIYTYWQLWGQCCNPSSTHKSKLSLQDYVDLQLQPHNDSSQMNHFAEHYLSLVKNR